MTAFTLDTSGRVLAAPNAPHAAPAYCWSDLNAFRQGYVGAALDEANATVWPDGRRIGALDLGFRHLAPETLAAMVKDCERMMGFYASKPSQGEGSLAWAYRQHGKFLQFPLTADLKPVTLYLGDDGKVRQREAGR